MSSPHAPPSDRVRGQLLFDAVVGAIAWVVIVAMQLGVTRSGHVVIEYLLLFAPLVVVPLGVRLSARRNERGKHPALFVVLSYLHPLAALAAVQAVLIDSGMPSGFAAGIWCAFCFVTAAWGAVRFFSAREKSLHEFAIDAGLLYLAIGGVWFTLTRLGERPMGFGHDIVALTAVHFHYAGFAAPIVVGLAGRALVQSGRSHVLWRIGARAVIVCPIVIAIGITTAPVVEVIAAFALAIALTMCMAVVALRVAVKLEPLPAVLLWTCAASLSMTMALACAYALGEFTNQKWIDVSRMAWIHGLVNVFGFALPGMVAWTLLERGRVGLDSARK
jgi:hypothetical protein